MKKLLGSSLFSIILGVAAIGIGLLQEAQESTEREAENAALVEATAQRTIELLKKGVENEAEVTESK